MPNFEVGQRVLYMGEHSWYLCKVENVLAGERITVRPVDQTFPFLPFDAPEARLIAVPPSVKTVEDVVAYLRDMKNW